MICVVYLIICFFENILGFNYLNNLIDDWIGFGICLLFEWSIEFFLGVFLLWLDSRLKKPLKKCEMERK